MLNLNHFANSRFSLEKIWSQAKMQVSFCSLVMRQKKVLKSTAGTRQKAISKQTNYLTDPTDNEQIAD